MMRSLLLFWTHLVHGEQHGIDRTLFGSEKQMNKAQELFDRSVKGLINQKFVRSADGSGHCMYRGPNGTKCAIGHLIEDSEYVKEMEGKSFYALIIRYGDSIKAMENLSDNEKYLLYDLQTVHDCFVPLDWMGEWGRIAPRYNLDTSVLKTHFPKESE